MFDERISTFQGVVREAKVAPEVGDLTFQFLSLLLSVNDLFDKNGMYQKGKGMAITIERCLDDLRSALAAGGNSPLLRWVRDSAIDLGEEIVSPTSYPASSRDRSISFASESRQFMERANVMMDFFSLARDREEILDQARQAVEEASSAADTAKRSAGITGGAKLSEHFGTYAGNEKRSADRFRIAAIGSVLVAFSVAVVFGPIEAGDWTHLTYRIASVAGAGTLAAYFARQAGQHRRIYNWARSLEVQLLSFPAFIEPLSDDERAEAYRALSRRILSSPPEKGTEGTEDSVGATQLVDLATAAMKRS